jgi:acetyl esterase
MRERKPIDPDLRRYLDALPPPPAGADHVRVARENMLKALAARTSIEGLPNDVDARDLKEQRIRLYTPPGASEGLLVYLHGGGWVIGSLETHDPFCRLLSAAARVRIASVDYRLAPEHPFPAAADDALAALRWAHGNASAVAIGGDSAGANLAAVTANRAPGRLAAQLLLYPVTDHPSVAHASWTENATGYGLEADGMRWFWDQYGAPPDDPRASPLRSPKLPALPPTLVATAEYDVLRDEGLAYADKLERAGVEVTRLHAPDMTHNFAVTPGLVARLPQCRSALREIAARLTSRLR